MPIPYHLDGEVVTLIDRKAETHVGRVRFDHHHSRVYVTLVHHDEIRSYASEFVTYENKTLFVDLP